MCKVLASGKKAKVIVYVLSSPCLSLSIRWFFYPLRTDIRSTDERISDSRSRKCFVKFKNWKFLLKQNLEIIFKCIFLK